MIETWITFNNHDASCLKHILVRVWFIINFTLGVLSAVLYQLSSKNDPHYALVAMLISSVALMSCIAELIYKGKKDKVNWQWRGRVPWFYTRPIGKPFGNPWELIGYGCALIQCVVTAIDYYFISHHLDGPIKISPLPILFALGLLCSKYFENPDRNSPERNIQGNFDGSSSGDHDQVLAVPDENNKGNSDGSSSGDHDQVLAVPDENKQGNSDGSSSGDVAQVLTVPDRNRQHLVDAVASFTKILSKSDAKRQMAIPSDFVKYLPPHEGGYTLHFPVLDISGKVWENFGYYIRPREERPKPIFQGDWRKYVLAKGLVAGDQIIFRVKQDATGALHYTIAAQKRLRLLGQVFWGYV